MYYYLAACLENRYISWAVEFKKKKKKEKGNRIISYHILAMPNQTV